MNAMLNGLKNATNYTVTENGAIAHKTTRSDLLDMFAMGAAYAKTDETGTKNAAGHEPRQS